MSANRFKWTREKYKKASRLSRLVSHLNLDGCPPLLRRYINLHAEYPEWGDWLLVPLKVRLLNRRSDWDWSDDVPF